MKLTVCSRPPGRRCSSNKLLRANGDGVVIEEGFKVLWDKLLSQQCRCDTASFPRDYPEITRRWEARKAFRVGENHVEYLQTVLRRAKGSKTTIHPTNEKIPTWSWRSKREETHEIASTSLALPFPIAAHRLSDPLPFKPNAVLETSDCCTPLPQERNDLPAVPPPLLGIPIQLGEVFTGLDPSLLLGTLLDVGNERDESFDCLHAGSKDVTDQHPAWGLPSALSSVRGRDRHRWCGSVGIRSWLNPRVLRRDERGCVLAKRRYSQVPFLGNPDANQHSPSSEQTLGPFIVVWRSPL